MNRQDRRDPPDETVRQILDALQGYTRAHPRAVIEGSNYAREAHPVVRVDFSQFRETAEELTEALPRQVGRLAEPYQVRLGEGVYYERFADLIRLLAARNPVVVLVDEYDKPIIDNLEQEEEARRLREVLKGFYGVLKGLDEYLRFVLLTGVSKFSQVRKVWKR